MTIIPISGDFMAKSSPKWCLWVTICISVLFVVIAGVLYLVNRNDYVEPVLCLLITSFFLWFLLILCGCTTDYPFSRCSSFILWSSSLLLVLFFVIYSFLLLARYERQNKLSIDLRDSSLNRFDLASSSSSLLNYSIAFQVSVTQHRKDSGVYFESFQIRARYQNHLFTSISFPAFFVAETANNSLNSSTVVLRPILEGIYPLELTDAQLNRYEQDAAGRIFRVDFTVEHLGFRCSFDEYKAIIVSNGPPLKHKLKDSRDFTLKGMSLPNGTGEWAYIYNGSFIASLVVLSFLALSSLTFCSAFLVDKKCCGSLSCMICLAVSIGLMVWVIGKEDRLSFGASETMISDFTIFPANGTLTYNLSLVISIGPNKKKTGIYLNELEVVAKYHGYNFTSFALSSPSYLQGKQKNGGRKLVFHSSLVGNSTPAFSGKVLKHYRKNKKSGCYTIDLLLSYKGFKTNKVKDFQRGRMVKGFAKFYRKFPEKCNKKETDYTPIYW